MQINGLTLRIALIQGLRNGLTNKLSSRFDGIPRGNGVTLQHALFVADPRETTLFDDLSTITSITMVMRRDNATGEFILQKDIGSGAFNPGMTWAQWDGNAGQQLSIALTPEDTNQPIEAGKDFAIYLAWEAMLASGAPVFLGSLKTVIYEEGVGTAGVPTTGDPIYYTAGQSDARYQPAIAAALAAAQDARAAEIFGKSISFDGTAQADFVLATPALGGRFTTVAWVANTSPYVFGVGTAEEAILDIANGCLRFYNAETGTRDSPPDPRLTDGNWHHLAASLDGGVITYYIDGLSIGTIADPHLYGGINRLGYNSGNPDSIARPVIYNRALSAPEMLALYQRGGVPLPAELGARMAALNEDSWVAQYNPTVFVGASATGFNFVDSGSGGIAKSQPSFSLRKGQRVRVSGTMASLAGAAQFELVDQSPLGAGVLPGVVAANGAFAVELVASRDALVDVWFSKSGGASLTAALSNLSVIPLGALVAIDDGDRSSGYQLADLSGNGHHLNLPAAGVKIARPRADGGRLVTRTATAGSQLAGRIPPRARILAVIAQQPVGSIWALAGYSVSLGSAPGAVNYVTATSITSVPRILQLTSFPFAAGNPEIWVNASDSRPLELVITYTLL